MSILFLLFIVQLVVACACLAITPPEQRNLIERTWNGSDIAQRVTVQKIFDCCGGESNDEEQLIEDHIYSCGNTTSVGQQLVWKLFSYKCFYHFNF